MAQYKERPINANPFGLGMEDGFNLLYDYETGTYINKPYVIIYNGLYYPSIGDYIIVYPGGTKDVLPPTEFNQKYEPV